MSYLPPVTHFTIVCLLDSCFRMVHSNCVGDVCRQRVASTSSPHRSVSMNIVHRSVVHQWLLCPVLAFEWFARNHSTLSFRAKIGHQQSMCDQQNGIQTNVERGKLEVRSNQLDQFLIGSGLAILAIVFGFVLKDCLSGVLESVDDRICNLPDTEFVLLVHYRRSLDGISAIKLNRTREDDRFDAVVFTELPDEEFGEVAGVDELAQGGSITHDLEWCPIL